MLSYTKKNNTHTAAVAAQTVEPVSSSVAAASKEPASSSAVKKTLFVRASRRVQKMLGLKKSVVAQLAPEPRVVFELGPSSDPYRNHARLSPSSSFNSVGVDLTRTTTTHHINRFSRYDSLLPVVVVPSSASAPACPELSPTSSFTSSLESSSPSTPSLTSLNDAHLASSGAIDADKKMISGLTRADRVQRRRPILTPTPRSSSSSSSFTNSSSDSDSDPIIPSDFLVAASSYRHLGPSSFSIGAVVPASVTESSFVDRSAGAMEGQGYSKEAVEAIRREIKEVGAERCTFVVSQVPVGVLEGECEVVVEWM